MGKMAILAFGIIVVSGLGISYLMYRQIGTSSTVVDVAPELKANGQGASCGDVDFVVNARSIGRWLLNVEKGKMISGVVTVEGDEQLDIGFGIWSPTNRVVLFEPERKHQIEFEVGPTIRGDYRFEFDNRHSSFTDKRIQISLCLT